MAERSELLQGTLDLLLLKILSLAPMHGWGITLRMEQMSGQVLLLNQGSLYPALERLKDKGWIRSEWQLTENNRRARYYSLTAAGRKQLAIERTAWRRASAAVNAIVEWAGAAP
jgi:PadR family transcriptional regulator, regulatory protein PadR